MNVYRIHQYQKEGEQLSTSLSAKSITELSRLIQNRDITVTELTHDILDRIKKLNRRLNAYITVNPEAESIAYQMDEHIKAGTETGPLHGIPIAIKDMIYTKDMQTTMGSKIYEHFIPNKDATVVKRLKKAGAIIIGKTNTHQFAYGPTGDRSYYGAMRNPYNTEKMAGGSSRGSASAVATGLCSGALGTDTSGSIRIPSSFCGLVGMKPTDGLLPLDGIYPLATSLDAVGPMTKTTQDSALLMNVLKGDNGFDNDIGKKVVDITVGIPYPFFLEGLNQEVATHLQTVIEHLKEGGITLKDIYIPEVDRIWHAQKTIIAYESYQLHKDNLTKFPADWDEEVKKRLQKSEKTADEYWQALKIQQKSKHTFKKAMKDVDALLTPTSPILTPDINQRIMRHTDMDGKNTMIDVSSSITRLTVIANIVGLPGLTIPSGFSRLGMPLGVQLTGKEFGEAVLYKIGYALEQSLGLNLGVESL